MHAPVAQKSTKSTKTQPSKRTKNKKYTQKISKGKIVTYPLICIFVHVKKRKLKKIREKSHNGKVLNTDVPTTRLMY